MEVNSITLYNEVTSDEDREPGSAIQDPFDLRRGFDYSRDPSGWPEIGEGYLEISIYVVNTNGGSDRLMRFKLNNLHSVESPDITFEYSINSPTSIIARGGSPQVETTIYNGSSYQIWNLLGQGDQDISKYYNNVELTNDLDGVPEDDIKISFNTALMGFPDGTGQIGHQYNPGDFVHLWRGVEYGIETSHQSYTKNNTVYNFRNWDFPNNNNHESSTTLRVLHNTDEFRSIYYATIPLTISNDLEGGSSNNDYEITWQTPPVTQTWQYGIPFNAFQYSLFLDLYSVTATDQFQALGTTWWFRNWDNGSTNNVRPNIQVNQPTNMSAYYKGLSRSNDADAYTNSQRKFVKTPVGHLHSVYESMGTVWYERSTDNGASWQLMNGGEPLSSGASKHPSIDYLPADNDNGVLITFQEKSGSNYTLEVIYYSSPTGNEDRRSIAVSESYTSEATPVICADTDNDFTILWKQQDGFYMRTGYFNELEGGIVLNGTQNVEVEYSEYFMTNPSIVVNKPNPHIRHLVWQAPGIYNSTDIFYAVLDDETLTNIQNISDGDGYPINYSPCISLADGQVVVTWTGHYNSQIPKISEEAKSLYRYKAITRVKTLSTWGSFTELGDNVNYVNNNSAGTSPARTVIIWSEGTTPASKWVKRTNGIFSSVHSLGNSGIQAQVSTGTGYENMTAMMFNSEQLPYYFLKSNADFTVEDQGGGIGKTNEAEELTYGRSGIVSKNRVEFVFNIGDVFVGDSLIKFLAIPDTLSYNSAESLNNDTRTVDFHLEESTEFYFSNLYYVIRQELADSLLTENDIVNFKAELVKSQTGEVLGTFDNVTYSKNNLEKYASINYQVDCSGIESGDYYLRLVTGVEGDSEYSLSNIIRNNFDLDKINRSTVSFKGNSNPVVYELMQNYPNPFNPSTTIKYQIPESGNVSLKVYDILGGEVMTLVNEEQVAGKYEINFDASKFASGVYLYRIQAGDFMSVKKMILLR